jgi:phosphoribosylanthranilate isomerase
MIAPVRVKICGLTNAQDAAHAAACGADFLGFVFAAGPRQVEIAQLAQWLDQVRGACEVVGVFRDAPLAEVEAAIERLDLDLVQLHGQERGPEWLALPVRVIQARAVDAAGVAQSRLDSGAWADLLDTASERGGGGTGKSFDWSLAVPVARSRRTFLAGGLTPNSVADAVRCVRPFAVDVASGVELGPGRKDPAKVAQFIQQARAAAGAGDPQERP